MTEVVVGFELELELRLKLKLKGSQLVSTSLDVFDDLVVHFLAGIKRSLLVGLIVRYGFHLAWKRELCDLRGFEEVVEFTVDRSWMRA